MRKLDCSSCDLWKGIAAILLGLIMVISPGITTTTLVVLVGVTLLVVGILILIGYFRDKRKGIVERAPVDGWVLSIMGLLLILAPAVFVSITMILLGILLVAAGIDQIVSLSERNRNGYRVSALYYLLPVLILIAGIVIMFAPFSSAASFIMLFGIALIVYGIVSLLGRPSAKKTE